jgi:alcohol dehydrogenase (cytochrome c)
VGGAAVWTTGTYDPGLNLMFYGTGNAQPMYDVEYRPGDNLFAGSVLAVNPDDGKIKWYFQYTPNEGWDYDETSVHQVISATVNGQPRTILYHWGRNGFAYRLDAATGMFYDAAQYIDGVNWTKGIDPKTGKPLEYNASLAVQTYIPETRPTRENGVVTACPNTHGGVRWQPPAYNPDTHITYTAALTGCFTKQVIAAVPIPNGNGLIDPKLGGGIKGAGPTVNVKSGGSLTAADVVTNKIIATVDYPYENESGVLATASGLIVTGYLDGRFVIYDDKTLQELWHFNSGIALKAPFIAYSVNGKEYLAVIAGGPTGASLSSQHPALAKQTTGAMLYVFSL